MNLNISSDSEVQFRTCFTEDHDEASGDNDNTLTHGVPGSDADDEDSCAGHARFLEDYVEAESDADDEPPLDELPPHTPPAAVDTRDNNAGAVVQPRPRNRGSRRKKKQGPGNQKHIVNFDGDDDYKIDRPVWKHGSTYPKDTIQVPDIEFQPEPPTARSDGLLFDPEGFQPLDFFYQMWPCELFDYIAKETN